MGVASSSLLQQCGLATSDGWAVDQIESGPTGGLQLGVELRRFHVALGFCKQKRSVWLGSCGNFGEKASNIQELMYDGKGEGEVD